MDKTKIMELLGEEEDNTDTGSLVFEKVSEFRYLGAVLSKNNDWARGIGVRIVKAERAAFALNKFLKSKVFSKKTKERLYTAIIRPTLTYGCEAWTTTSNTERKLRTFENKIWWVICGPLYDNEKGTWRRKYNKELQEEMEMASVPAGKRPRGRPRKRWLNGVEEDLHRMGVQDWKELAQDRDKWRDLVMAVKTLKEY
ncbi:hypothetical protein AGLY_014022 [Aphis glycines]|uniref:Reverse transcriptase domain-containing protein n=1 Tax=Aphis glycines TaxID=307491 RepID=A0A6G0T4V0_APHGL|nr:hypothetical protein AGLY_014022 [Aphis glycines]